MSYDFFDQSISDKEFAERFLAAYNQETGDAKPEDFEVNPIQMEKLNNLVEFFRKAAKDLGGRIISVDIDPVLPPNGVTANFIVFDIAGNDVKRFCDVIRECSALSMDVTVNDEISISCTIPNVFVRKS